METSTYGTHTTYPYDAAAAGHTTTLPYDTAGPCTVTADLADAVAAPTVTDPPGRVTPLNIDNLAMLLKAAQERDDEAWSLLHRRYNDRLVRSIEHWLHLFPGLRVREGADDIAQQAWKAFFLCVFAGAKFPTPEAAPPFLWKVAWLTALQLWRHHFVAQKRSLRREIAIRACQEGNPAFVLTRDDPAPLTEHDDEVIWMLESYPEPLAHVLVGLLSGDNLRQLARKEGVSQRTIRRRAQQCAELRRKVEQDSRS